MILPVLLASFDNLQKQLPLPSQTYQEVKVIIYELSSSFASELAGAAQRMTPFFDGDRAFTTCAVPSLGKAKSSTADSSASAAQRSFHQIARRVRPGGHLINADL